MERVRPVVRDGDLYLPVVDLWLDPSRRRPKAFISHAHSDHARCRHGEILCTAETAAFLRLRFRSVNCQVLPYDEPLRIRGCTVRLVPSGHVLGSAQLVVEQGNWRFVYTGDFKLAESLTCPAARILPADCLLIEATYAQRRYRFPSVERSRAEILDFAERALADGAVPVFLGYSIGKGPEIVRILQRAGYDVAVCLQIARTVAVYRRYGVPFDGLQPWVGRPGCPVVATPWSWRRSARRGSPLWRVAMVTGWALDQPDFGALAYERMIPLSDHADWPALWRYVQTSAPREVFVVHGYARAFASALRHAGYDARMLEV